MLYVLAAVAGLTVLAACGVRVLVAARALGHEVRRTEQRLGPRLAALERATDRGDPSQG